GRSTAVWGCCRPAAGRPREPGRWGRGFVRAVPWPVAAPPCAAAPRRRGAATGWRPRGPPLQRPSGFDWRRSCQSIVDRARAARNCISLLQRDHLARGVIVDLVGRLEAGGQPEPILSVPSVEELHEGGVAEDRLSVEQVG